MMTKSSGRIRPRMNAPISRPEATLRRRASIPATRRRLMRRAVGLASQPAVAVFLEIDVSRFLAAMLRSRDKLRVSGPRSCRGAPPLPVEPDEFQRRVEIAATDQPGRLRRSRRDSTTWILRSFRCRGARRRARGPAPDGNPRNQRRALAVDEDHPGEHHPQDEG